MAALVEGQQYGLSAQDKSNCTKSLVFVKLTDSALRSIEEYVKNKGDSISRPTIQFQNSNGVISLPQNGSSQNYGFTLSNVEADGPHGSFECLRQTGYRSLESLGCLQVKMHIHANEDSYENTRVKMAAVEKEQKKSCTKVIKPAGAHLGRKIKVKRPGLVVSPMKSSPPTASMAPKPIQPVKPVIAQPCSPPEAKPSFHLKRPEVPKPNAPKKNPELMRQPIRDRIIHILAVRPYKRPELLVRLNHEGVREKDKNKLTSILPQLSILKGNIYYLANYLWNEVQDNWKFCTQEELEIIRKRKQQHLNNSSENEITPPSFSQPNNSPAQKRLSSDVMPNGNPRSKKQRISHYKGEPQRPSYNGTSELSIGTFNRKSPYSPGRASLSANSPEEDTEPSYHSSSSLSSGPNRLSPNFHPKTREDSPRIREDKPSRTREENTPRIREDNPRIRDDNPRTREDEKGMANNVHRLSPGVNQKENSRTKEDAARIREDIPRIREDVPRIREDVPKIREDVPRIREDVPRIREDVPRIREDGARSRVSPPVARDKPPPVARKEVSAARVNNISDTTLGKPPSQPLLSQPRPLESKSPQVSPDSNTPQKGGGSSSKTASSNGYVNSISKNGYGGSQPSYVSNRSKVTSTTNGSCSNSPHSSCDSMEYTDTIQDIQVPPPNDSPEQCDSPEYEKEYGRIVNSEQRAKYKAHFNAEYQEYLCLHEEIISISNKFANLERHLHTCTEGSPEFKKIKSKIFKEYRAYQQNPNYVENLKKFNFLHNKLAYIKRLVAEYDNAQCVKS